MMCELHLNKVDRKRLWGNKKEQLHPVHTTGAVLGWCLEVTKTDEGLEASQVNSGTRDFHVLLKIMRDQESWGGGEMQQVQFSEIPLCNHRARPRQREGRNRQHREQRTPKS